MKPEDKKKELAGKIRKPKEEKDQFTKSSLFTSRKSRDFVRALEKHKGDRMRFR